MKYKDLSQPGAFSHLFPILKSKVTIALSQALWQKLCVINHFWEELMPQWKVIWNHKYSQLSQTQCKSLHTSSQILFSSIPQFSNTQQSVISMCIPEFHIYFWQIEFTISTFLGTNNNAMPSNWCKYRICNFNTY